MEVSEQAVVGQLVKTIRCVDGAAGHVLPVACGALDVQKVQGSGRAPQQGPIPLGVVICWGWGSNEAGRFDGRSCGRSL